MGRVSCIVSAYFCADYLQRRVENLRSLAPEPEIIIVCHFNSPEWRIALDFRWAREGKDTCIVDTHDVITWGAAMNAGIRWAAGDYIAVANSDDEFYPHGLNFMAEYLDTHADAGIVHGDCDVRGETGNYAWKRPGESVSLAACRVGPMPMWRKSLHARYGWFDETFQVAADYDFWLRCATRGVGVAHIDRAVGLYELRPDSLEHRNRDVLAAENAEIRRRYADRT